MATAQEVIKNFMSSLDNTTLSGTEALDEATRASSSFNSWQEVINSMVSDCAEYNGDGTGFLQDKCGINLYNEDIGAITGYDAGTDTVKTAESIVPETGPWTSPNGSSSTISSLTVNWPDSRSLTQAQKTIVNGLNTWWIGNALSLIKDSYGLSFEGSNASVKEITVNFVNDNSTTLAYVSAGYRQSGFIGTYKTYSLSLNINMNYFNDISSTDSNGVSSKSSFYLDRVIAHELTHAVVMATVDNTHTFPTYFEEGMAELTHGIDDARKYDILSLANDSSKLSRLFRTDSSSGMESYAGGYMLLRYFAKQASDNANSYGSSVDNLPNGATVNGTTLTLSGSFGGSVWLQGWDVFAGKEVYKNETIVTIDATQTSSDGMILAGNWLDNVIKAGSGNNTYLWGGDGGNDTLVGGAGRDMFWLGIGCGSDFADNFTIGDSSSSDIVNFYYGGIGPIYRSNGTVVLTIEDGSSLSLNVGSSVESVIQYSFDSQNVYKAKIGNSYENNTLYYDSSVSFYKGGELSDTLMVTGGGEHQIWLDGSHGKLFDNIDNIDAANSYGTYELAGDYRDNTVSSGNGVSSLFGGWGGNDTLNGGSGQDMFWVGKNLGDDVINNVSANDTVNFFNAKLSDISGINISDNNIYFNFYEGGSVTVAGGASAGNAFILGEDGVSWKYNNNDGYWYTV